MVKFVLKFIDQKVQRTFGLNVGCKFGSSVVLLSGGSQNFQPHIQTKKSKYPPPAWTISFHNMKYIKSTSISDLSIQLYFIIVWTELKPLTWRVFKCNFIQGCYQAEDGDAKYMESNKIQRQTRGFNEWIDQLFQMFLDYTWLTSKTNKFSWYLLNNFTILKSVQVQIHSQLLSYRRWWCQVRKETKEKRGF